MIAEIQKLNLMTAFEVAELIGVSWDTFSRKYRDKVGPVQRTDTLTIDAIETISLHFARNYPKAADVAQHIANGHGRTLTDAHGRTDDNRPPITDANGRSDANPRTQTDDNQKTDARTDANGRSRTESDDKQKEMIYNEIVAKNMMIRDAFEKVETLENEVKTLQIRRNELEKELMSARSDARTQRTDTDGLTKQLTDARTLIRTLTDASDAMTDELTDARTQLRTLGRRTNIFEKEIFALVCFVGMICYQSYETGLSLLNFHQISGKDIPSALAFLGAFLMGCFGIVLTMNTPKDDFGDYTLKPLLNYEIGVFLFNAFLFVPGVWDVFGLGKEVIFSCLYCATIPFMEYVFGKVYLTKKQDREKLLAT